MNKNKLIPLMLAGLDRKQRRASGLPAPNAGGLLVSSSLSPLLAPDQPADTHVPGFLTTSVVTLRLWKTPAESAAGSAP